MSDPTRSLTKPLWYLEGFMDLSGRLYRVPIHSLPFRVGRQAGLELTLPLQIVSFQHAELYEHDGRLMVRDLGSTNGTFLNQELLTGQAPLDEGDILHFATLEFRLGLMDAEGSEELIGSTAVISSKLPQLVVEKAERLRVLLQDGGVRHEFQAIVGLSKRDLLGYEVLGRGDSEGLPSTPYELFDLAAVLGVEVELSELLRQHSFPECASFLGAPRFFFNTHPRELREDRLLRSLERARSEFPQVRMAIEIHEAAVTDSTMIQRLMAELQRFDVLLVYDDFGAGQARLLELADVPPDFLKFDRSLIEDIDGAPPARRRLLASLAKLALDLGIDLIAEGVETEEEAAVCRGMGFAYGQGYLFSRPQSSDQLIRGAGADQSGWTRG
ncbi:MAG: EAL domain-containing protein [Thermoanaerobaculia bacterium]